MSTAHWLALTQIAGIGGVTARRLLERFGSIESVFEATVEELAGVPRVSERVAREIREAPLGQLEAELWTLCDEGISILTWDDDAYPANLRAAADAPPLLFLRGDVREGDRRAVAIVGTRQPSPAASQIAETLGRELANRGLTVVSGLARGIDTAAHEGALGAGGRTLAVLGSGLRVIHPRENSELAGRIVSQGAVLSELHPGAPPAGRQLMARNRIVTGLSKAVVVVEAGERSGSLDAAKRARKQGRLVYAVDNGSAGTSRLLSEGAEPLPSQDIDYDDLAERLGTLSVSHSQKPVRPAQQQMRLWSE
jgi:DNA processing protein